MIFETPKKILALSPHTDDIELGCAGTLNRLKGLGSEIFILNFSLAPPSEGYDESMIKKEFSSSASLIGADFKMLNLPIRHLSEHRQQILDELFKLNSEHNFDLVFCHSTYDQHQDHQTVQAEAFRAFKNTTILGYELPWNCMKFSTDIFVKLKEDDMQKKLEMINAYKSQLHRGYMCKDYIYSIAKTRGLQIRTEYAECFELIRGVF